MDNRALAIMALPSKVELEYKTQYRKPVEVGHYSKDCVGNVVPNSRQALSQYKDQKLPMDLNIGYPENYIKRDPVPVRLNDLLNATKDLKHNNVEFLTCSDRINIGRGIATKILSTPYFERDDWELGATLYNGTIYMEEHKFPQESYANEDLQTYYGYNFESLCTDSSEIPKGGANTNIQFCSIFETKLDKFTMLMGAEVDCVMKTPVDSSASSYQSVYAELKTHKECLNKNHEKSYIRNKLLKTWLQCYLAGINNVVFGFRTPQGQVVKIQKYLTNELPRLARKQQLWDPFVCLTFGAKVLAFLKKNIVIDDSQTVYTIKYSGTDKTISISQPSVGGDLVFVKI